MGLLVVTSGVRAHPYTSTAFTCSNISFAPAETEVRFLPKLQQYPIRLTLLLGPSEACGSVIVHGASQSIPGL